MTVTDALPATAEVITGAVAVVATVSVAAVVVAVPAGLVNTARN